MIGMQTVWVEGWGNGYQTYEVNFGPVYTVAQASLTMTSGSGTHAVGIVAYRYRPNPSGAEQSVNYGPWTSWPNYIWGANISSVTFGVATGSNQSAKLLGNLFFW